MKDGKIRLILGNHAHVPSGANESEFENVYADKILPFVSNMHRYSKIQAVLHYSGVLLHWIERAHPEFFMLIEDMVSRKQIEILSGGFYEPMLPLIPLQDRIGQIELLTTYLRKHFGKRPLGCMIPRMVWEQHLTAVLAASDMSFTFLSQDQFALSGLSREDLLFPCITEDQGKVITVFPVSVDAGTALTEKSFSRVFNEFKNRMEKERGGFPDGGVIAVFPGKPARDPEEIQEAAWNRFFEEISLSENFIETVLPGKILKSRKPLKKTSFPNSSCFKDDFSPRRFIIDHGEINGIYSKMIFTNVLIGQLRGDKTRKQSAKEELWKAQDSCLFATDARRHELRKAAYSSLLRAEMLSREKGKFAPSLIQHDFDLDNVPEFIFQDVKMNCYIQLRGASLFELDYLPKEWNYLDCGCNGSKRRTAFADAILPSGTVAENAGGKLPAGSRLCFSEQFEAVSQDRKGKICFKLPAAEKGAPFAGLKIEKCYSLKKDVLTVNYVLKNSGEKKEKFCFMPEINLSFAGEGEESVRFFSCDSSGKNIPASDALKESEKLIIHDVKNEAQIMLASTRVFSCSISHAIDNGLYQATRILPLINLSAESGESLACEFNLKFSH
ncbi:MAG: DUF1926 domain-containing protein [Treponema sp.]|jgi:hypothetical protein|nr:DUF1926 domain-containing protein [Treponema sp.]